MHRACRSSATCTHLYPEILFGTGTAEQLLPAHNPQRAASQQKQRHPCQCRLPATLDLSAGYRGTLDNTETKLRATGETTKENGVFDQTIDAGINLSWIIFDGFNITANYQKLKELERQGETNIRIAIEDLIANIAAEYYNYVQHKIRLNNFRYAVSLSKERLRIVEERYHIGNFSRLDYQQAKVDFNADSAQYMKQQELLHTSRIQLNELMASENVDQPFIIRDSLIDVSDKLNFEELWNATLQANASLLKAEQNNTLARLDYKKVSSRDYPYVKMNGGYGYTLNKYDISANSRRSNLGLNVGVTVASTSSTATAVVSAATHASLCRTPAWNESNWNKPCVPT